MSCTIDAVPVVAYVGLGANLGDAAATVRDAARALARLPQTRLCACSRLYRSAPLAAEGPDFINAVARLRTMLCAPALLRHLQRLEHAAGRTRPYRHAPRTLDLDLLLYGSGRMNSPALTLPHPRMMGRAFVLLPLAELAPQLVPPAARQHVADQICEPLVGIAPSHLEPDATANVQ